MTQQATYSHCFQALVVSRFWFLQRTYERTDTICENNDHLLGRGLVDQ